MASLTHALGEGLAGLPGPVICSRLHRWVRSVGTARGAPSPAPQGRRRGRVRAPDRGTHDAWRDMHGTQFAQFSAEVLRRGAAAVLPQHLPDRWLDALLAEADLLAPGEGDAEEEDLLDECCAGLL